MSPSTRVSGNYVNALPGSPQLLLLDQLGDRIRFKHYSMRTGPASSDWMRRFGLFHNKRHPGEMSAREVETFLTHLAVTARVAASTQNQSKSVLSLSKRVLASELGPNDVESAPCRNPRHSARDAGSVASGGDQQAGHTTQLAALC